MNRKTQPTLSDAISQMMYSFTLVRNQSHSYANFLIPPPPSPQILSSSPYPSQAVVFFPPLSKNHNDQALVQGEHATVILCLNLSANNHNESFLCFHLK